MFPQNQRQNQQVKLFKTKLRASASPVAPFHRDKLWGCSSSALLRTIYSGCAVLQGKKPGWLSSQHRWDLRDLLPVLQPNIFNLFYVFALTPKLTVSADTSKGGRDLICRGMHLARASCPAHCTPSTLTEVGETLWLGTCHGGSPWARRAEQEAPRCHSFARAPVPAGDHPDLSPPAAHTSQQAKPAAAPSQNASKKLAASQPHDSCTSQSLDTLPAFHWLQEDTQTSTKSHQREVNLFKLNK